jgi:hypothetical protein
VTGDQLSSIQPHTQEKYGLKCRTIERGKGDAGWFDEKRSESRPEESDSAASGYIRNDVLIGCPLCGGDLIPPPAMKKPPATPTGGAGQ